MRNKACSFLATLAFAASVAMPFQANAVTFEDSFENCSYPKLADLILIRPIGISSAILSSGFFALVAAPLALLTAPTELPMVARKLVAEPWGFVLNRPLGECNSITVDF